MILSCFATCHCRYRVRALRPSAAQHAAPRYPRDDARDRAYHRAPARRVLRTRPQSRPPAVTSAVASRDRKPAGGAGRGPAVPNRRRRRRAGAAQLQGIPPRWPAVLAGVLAGLCRLDRPLRGCHRRLRAGGRPLALSVCRRLARQPPARRAPIQLQGSAVDAAPPDHGG